jgi:serine phosphatase RsbU (regulator of sigma subunit)
MPLEAPAGLLDELSEAVLAVDGQGIVVFANEAVETLLGRAPDEVAGLPVTGTIPAEHATLFRHTHRGPCGGQRAHLSALRHDLVPIELAGLFTCAQVQGRAAVVGILRPVGERPEPPGSVVERLLAVLSEALPREETADRLLGVVGEGLGWDAATLWTLDEAEGMLRCAAVWESQAGSFPRFTAELRRHTLPGGTDLSAIPGWELAVEEGLEGFHVFPVRRGPRSTGAVALFRRSGTAPDALLLASTAAVGSCLGEILARQAADQEGRQLLGRLRLAERRQRFLSDASRVLTSTLGHETALVRLAELIVGSVADGCLVDLMDDEGHVRRIAVVLADPGKQELAQPLRVDHPPDLSRGEGVSRVLRTGEPLLYPSMPDALLTAIAHNDEHLRLLRALAPSSEIIVPLTGLGRIQGALTFIATEPDAVFTSGDLVLAEELARRAGLAVATAKLYEQELTVASVLQQSLLPPRLPDVPGVDVAARLYPGGSGVVVGGDFYDLFAIADGQWAFAIGDVCGKGAAAAARTGQVRHSMRALAVDGRPPVEVLTAVNRLLLDDSDEESLFCTAAYGLVRPRPGGAVVQVASAGHPLPLLRHPGGAVEVVRCAGTLLGVLEVPELNERTVQLSAGDTLVLYTDGVIEARDATEWFGERRLHQLLARSGGLDAAGVAARIESAALDFSAGAANDDLAVLVMQAGAGRGQAS